MAGNRVIGEIIVGLAFLLTLGCGAKKPNYNLPPPPTLPIPKGYVADGACMGDAFDVHGVPNVMICKDKHGKIVGVYKRERDGH